LVSNTCSCTAIRCPDIPDPDNGDIVFSPDTIALFDLATEASYVCDRGFALVGGDETSICVVDPVVNDGIWTGERPNCTG